MTQGRLFPAPRVYAIDADCIIGLDNKHMVLRDQAVVPEFTECERRAIWNGLEELASIGRIKLVPAVSGELQRHNPEGRSRLTAHRRTRVQRTNAVIELYQELVERYSDWRPRGHERYDQGDPWLLAFAMDRNYTIVSNEKRAEEQAGGSRSRTKIPDVCRTQSVECLRLRELAVSEGWIS